VHIPVSSWLIYILGSNNMFVDDKFGKNTGSSLDERMILTCT